MIISCCSNRVAETIFIDVCDCLIYLLSVFQSFQEISTHIKTEQLALWKKGIQATFGSKNTKNLYLILKLFTGSTTKVAYESSKANKNMIYN